jgi:UMF1 family MFS transporter
VARTMVFFLITQVSFIGANVMYDAFLPQIASDREMDRVSAKGYAFGYIGGGVQFALPGPRTSRTTPASRWPDSGGRASQS